MGGLVASCHDRISLLGHLVFRGHFDLEQIASHVERQGGAGSTTRKANATSSVDPNDEGGTGLRRGCSHGNRVRRIRRRERVACRAGRKGGAEGSLPEHQPDEVRVVAQGGEGLRIRIPGPGAVGGVGLETIGSARGQSGDRHGKRSCGAGCRHLRHPGPANDRIGVDRGGGIDHSAFRDDGPAVRGDITAEARRGSTHGGGGGTSHGRRRWIGAAAHEKREILSAVLEKATETDLATVTARSRR